MSRSDRASYDQTQIDWHRLGNYAQRVARETRVPRGSETMTQYVTRQREVRGGLLGLSTRIECYSEPVTSTVTADHWVLDQRYWRKNEKLPGGRVKWFYEWIYYCLGVDGSLLYRLESADEIEGCHENRDDPIVRPMSDYDVEQFDFEPLCVSRRGQFGIESNLIRDDKKLRHHAKGVGLSLALKKLLERHASQ